MTSKNSYDELFVWIWLPDQVDPVVAGKLTRSEKTIFFTYGKSYLENPKAIAIYDKELPLQNDVFEKKFGTEVIFGSIRDAAPDAWGRRVILNKILGAKGKSADPANLSEFTYLLESGSDRIGGLDFQLSAKHYEPRLSEQGTLEELINFTKLIESGTALTGQLAQAINHGTSIGGARPKATINDNDANIKYIAKFSSSSDQYNVIKAEYIAMRMADLCGLDVAKVKLERAAGKDVLLIERFDREFQEGGWSRKIMLSSLTLLGLDEMTPHYASYEDFAEIIRHRFTDPKDTLREMFRRIVFNILCGNTDDHARNHAAFWNGKDLTLTPAYDLCPQMRYGGEASQAMMIFNEDRSSRLVTCIASAKNFMLSDTEAREIIESQISVINDNWKNICDESSLSSIERELFKGSLFLNPYAFEGY